MISEIFDADNDGIYEAQVYGMSPYVTFGPEADMYTMLVHLLGITSGETYSYVPADPSEPVKQGLVQDEDGEIRYYVDGEPTYAGVVQDAEGNLYYINSTLKAVRSCKYGIGESRTNGLIESGIYEFGEDGKLIPATDPGEPAKQGLVQDEDGEIRYYVDGEPTYAGVVQDAEGNLYYINSTLKAVRNCKYGIGTARTNGLIESGVYEFDEDGKLIR